MQAVLWSASDAGRTGALAFPALQSLPAVFSHQRHETHRRDFFALQLVASTCEHVKDLLVAIAERDQNSPALGQLLVISRRNFRSAGADEYRIVGRILPPAQRSISQQERDVASANELDCSARFIEQGRDPLDRENLSGELRQERGLITRSRSDLQDFFAALQVQ